MCDARIATLMPDAVLNKIFVGQLAQAPSGEAPKKAIDKSWTEFAE